MRAFVYNGFPARVVFGVGCVAQLPVELDRLGVQRALVLSTAARAARIVASLGERAAGVYDRAAMHVPLAVVEEARRLARSLGVDCCVTVGGGSTTGLGKAIALTSGLPIIAVPTTYAGSEMTTIYGITDSGAKRTGRDARVLPKTVLYDPALTLGLPSNLSAASGMNAIAHCVEALYAPDGNPVVSLMAEEGIRALAAALPEVMRAPASSEARSEALYGAWLAGAALGGASMGLHHRLCHVLGGAFNLPHAETHAIVLPHAARYNRDAVPEAMTRVARALGADDAPAALYDLEAKLGLTLALKDIGMPAEEIEQAARSASENPYSNPRPVTYDGVLQLLRAAYAGTRPV